MMESCGSVVKELEVLKDKKTAEILQRFFKTGKGEYGEGDVFLGIRVPVQRQVAKRHASLRMTDIQKLLESKVHEHRMVALLILLEKYKSEDKSRGAIFRFYLNNAKRVNNWDLVDLSCPGIVGDYLSDKPRKVLYKLASSANLWERRISIVSTYAFIRKGDYKDTLNISEMLLGDGHDLIHKAVGWMLREVGKKDAKVLKAFLDRHCRKMPRTMLRYAIERLPESERKRYLRGTA